MARPLRLEHPGALWHVTARGNERRDVYRSDADREFFLELLGEVVFRQRWLLHAWVLMSNHYHLLVETPLPTLSVGVKRINEVYAEQFNFRHHRVGHLFQGRFKSILVERESHLLELVRYIVLNPVRCGAVASAGEYPWSNYRATAGLAPAPDWLEVGWTHDQFGGESLTERCSGYRTFVADGRGATYRPWENVIGQIYLGGTEFCDGMQRLVHQRARSSQHPKPQREFVHWSFDRVLHEILVEFGETHDSIRERSHRPARKALGHLAARECGLSLSAIGEWLRLTDRAVSHLVRRSVELEKTDAEYRQRLQRIREHHQ